jgi:23S rRNA (uracil1939-C5)-methyltransferase
MNKNLAHPQIGEHIELHIQSHTVQGDTLSDWNGLKVHVFGAIPGEKVIAEITRITKDITYANTIQILDGSTARVNPGCVYFGKCTGCQWQHISYDQQLEIKRDAIIEAMKANKIYENFEIKPVKPSNNIIGYRNHARFTVGPRRMLGFVNRITRKFVQIDKCEIMYPKINNFLSKLQGNVEATSQLSIRYGINTDSYLIQPKLINPNISVESGQKYYNEEINNHLFRVASPSFFQTNSDQIKYLIEIISKELKLTGNEVIADAYAGVGTFAILLSPFSKHVYAIEESPSAINDAKINAEGINNIEFITSKTENALKSLSEKLNAVILDPPRKGCHENVLTTLNQLKIPKLIYVSCDPDSLARDLKVLTDGNYQINLIQPIDLFPQTHHVESIAVLSPKILHSNSQSELVLASTSPRRKALLSKIQLTFTQLSPNIIESVPSEIKNPVDIAKTIAYSKLIAISNELNTKYIIAADTLVFMQKKIFEKPKSSNEAIQMLKELRGQKHKVVTALAIRSPKTDQILIDHNITEVTMRKYSDLDIEKFVLSGSPFDKSGAYAIQDKDFKPVKIFNGCYTNVLGLPLCTMIKLLNELEFKWDSELLLDSKLSNSICTIAESWDI